MAAVDYTGFRWNRSDKFYNPRVGKGAVLFNGNIQSVRILKHFQHFLNAKYVVK